MLEKLLAMDLPEEAKKIIREEIEFRKKNISWDSLDRTKSGRYLVASEKGFRELVEFLPQTVYEIDLTGKLTYANKAGLDTFAYSEDDVGRIGAKDLIASEDHEKMEKNIQRILSGDPLTGNEYTAVRSDGSRFPAVIYSTAYKRGGKPAGLRGIILDITRVKEAERERRELEKKLIQAEKMQALGLLAGVVAHDLNNILSGIVGYPDLILKMIPEDSPVRKYALMIKDSGRRAAEVAGDLLTFARRGVIDFAPVNVNTVIRDFLASAEYESFTLSHKSVRVEADLDARVERFPGSEIHIRQSIVNLVLNAAEAMPDGGVLKISTRMRLIEEPFRGYDTIEPGEYVVVIVSDTGEGMTDEQLRRIFEPFYSNKIMGKSGTGLGLTVVWGTLKDHNGFINIESSPGDGSQFELYFPVDAGSMDN